MSKIVNFKAQKKPESSESASAQAQADPRQYSPDEVSDIIGHALRKIDDTANDSVVHSELLSIAKEFGLEEDDIEKAYDSLLDERDMAALMHHMWFQFKFVTYVNILIVIGLFAVDFFLFPDAAFAQFSLIGLAIGTLIGGVILKAFPKLAKNLFASSSNLDSGSAPSFTTRKFYISSWAFLVYSGRNIEKGIVRIEGDSLLMEYRKVDGLLGVLKSRVKEVRVPLNQIVGVELERKYWMSKLTLQSTSLKTFEDVPGESDGKLELTFAPRARVAVINLARDIESRISRAD